MGLKKVNTWVSKLKLTYDTKKTRADGLQDVYKTIADWAKDFDTIKSIIVYSKVDVTSGYGSKKIPLLLDIMLKNDKAYRYQILANKGYVSLKHRTLYGFGWETEQVIYGEV